MSVNTTVLYPNDDPNAWFDLDYYIKTHTAMVVDRWVPYGLKNWTIIQFTDGRDGSSPQFRIGANFTWESMEGATNAMTATESKAIFDDVPNFTTIIPVLISGTVAASWKGES